MVKSRPRTTTTLAAGLLALLYADGAAFAEQPGGGSDAITSAQQVYAAEQLQSSLDRAREDFIVVHFWASWCLPCREEMRTLETFRQRFYPELNNQGMRLLTVNNDVRDQDLQRFLDEYEVNFPVYYDPLARIRDRYQVKALPTTIVLGPDGEVRERLLGEQDWTSRAVVERLRAQLQQRAVDSDRNEGTE